MTILNLKCGQTEYPIRIDASHVSLITSKPVVSELSETEIVRNALHHPIDSLRLDEILKAGDTVAIVIPDVTRAWQKPSLYLGVLVEELKKCGLKDDQLLFISGVGTHRKQSEAEHRKLIGDELYARIKIVDHDSRDDSNLTYVGTTSRKTEVFINKLALSYDHIIVSGGIVFHDLAGFGGGRKGIVPGIAGYKTVMQNHAHSLNPNGSGANPDVRSNLTDGNPFHEDLMEAVAFVNPSFLLNVLVDENGNIMHAVAGNYITAHQAGCEFLRSIDLSQIPFKAEVVVASCGGYPKDINFYQATKSLVNAIHACKLGGDILLLAECNEGLGHPEMEAIYHDFETNAQREAHVKEHYTIAKFFAYMTCVWAEEYKIHLVSSLDKDVMKRVGIDVYDSLDEALHVVHQRYDGAYHVYVMPSAGSTLPELTGEEA